MIDNLYDADDEPALMSDGWEPQTLLPTDALAVDYECAECGVEYTFKLSKFTAGTGQPDVKAIRDTPMKCPNCGTPSKGPLSIRVIHNYPDEA
jgi:predicted RNA-binding Zn-ribbon protein involved in translation (DUF1610 family)